MAKKRIIDVEEVQAALDAAAEKVRHDGPSDGKFGPVRRSEIIGERVDREVRSEAEHFMQCPKCGGHFDKRDLAQVFEHEGPLPHPVQDQPQ
jgi:hypothetical protein